MIIADLPPAVSPPAKLCSNGKPQDFNSGDSSFWRSPDCRWVLAFKGDTAPQPSIRLDHKLKDDEAVLAEASTGKIILSFNMERSATAYWLTDRKALVINYYAGSDSTRPLVIRLGLSSFSKPIDLSLLVYPDVLKRIHKHSSQVYHYYVRFVADHGDQVTITASPDFVKHSEEGEGDSRCYLYSVDKATFRHYRFVKELPDDCSGDAGE